MRHYVAACHYNASYLHALLTMLLQTRALIPTRVPRICGFSGLQKEDR